MKKFTLHLLLLILTILTILFLLDFGYTYVYNNCIARNKLQYALKAKDQKYDAAFFGSSRVANHIDTKLFEKLSKKTAINLGAEGAGLNDNLLQIKLFIKNNTVKTIYLQVDDNIEITENSNITRAEAMPFIGNEIVNQQVKKSDVNFNSLYYIPFYRYAINDSKIGFRELLFSILNKKPKTNLDIGFTPQFGNLKCETVKSKLGDSKKIKENIILNEIIETCNNNNIQIVLYMSPFCSKIETKEYVEKLKKIKPSLIDLTTGFNDTLFYNCKHLNIDGAKLLTERLYYSKKI